MKKPNKSKLQRVNSSMSVMLFTAFEFDRTKKLPKNYKTKHQYKFGKQDASNPN